MLDKLNEEWHKENNTGDFHTSDITHNSGITYTSGNIPSESNSSYIQTLNIKVSIQINVEKKTWLQSYPRQRQYDTYDDQHDMYDDTFFDVLQNQVDNNNHVDNIHLLDGNHHTDNHHPVHSTDEVRIQMNIINKELFQEEYPISDMWDIGK